MSYAISKARPFAPSINVIGWIVKMYEVSKQRRTLAQLDDSRLQDLGLNYRQASKEANRAVWDI